MSLSKLSRFFSFQFLVRVIYFSFFNSSSSRRDVLSFSKRFKWLRKCKKIRKMWIVCTLVEHFHMFRFVWWARKLTIKKLQKKMIRDEDDCESFPEISLLKFFIDQISLKRNFRSFFIVRVISSCIVQGRISQIAVGFPFLFAVFCNINGSQVSSYPYLAFPFPLPWLWWWLWWSQSLSTINWWTFSMNHVRHDGGGVWMSV